MQSEERPPRQQRGELAEAQKAIPPAILDLSQEAWTAWKQHPISLAYLQYLEDLLTAHRRAALETWEALLRPDGALLAENRGRVLQLKELLNLEMWRVCEFYGLPDPRRQEAEEDSE